MSEFIAPVPPSNRIMLPIRQAHVWSLCLALAAMVLIWIFPSPYLLLGLATLVAAGAALLYPVAGFCLLAFSIPWLSGYPVPVGSFPLTLTEVLVAALGAGWLSVSAHRRTTPIVRTLWTPYIFMFLAAILLSLTQAADSHASMREIFKWVEVAVVYFAAISLLKDRRERRWLVASVVAAGVTQAVLGYVQFAFHAGPDAFGLHRAFFRAYGTFDQPNPFAGYLNIPFALALSQAAWLPASRARFFYALSAPVLFGGVLASGSRGALIATLVTCAVIATLRFPEFRRLIYLGLVGLAGAALLANLGLLPVSPFERVLNAVGLGNVSFDQVTNANFSAVERAAHWLAGARMFAAHPILGVGIGNYAVAYPAFHPRGWYASLEHAHNYYINIAAESGIVGFVAYALMVGSALWYSYSAVRRANHWTDRATALGVLGALVATAFHNLFDVLYVHGLAVLLGMLMALVPLVLREGKSDKRDEQAVTSPGVA